MGLGGLMEVVAGARVVVFLGFLSGWRVGWARVGARLGSKAANLQSSRAANGGGEGVRGKIEEGE